jgi:hypothetical protein
MRAYLGAYKLEKCSKLFLYYELKEAPPVACTLLARGLRKDLDHCQVDDVFVRSRQIPLLHGEWNLDGAGLCLDSAKHC